MHIYTPYWLVLSLLFAFGCNSYEVGLKECPLKELPISSKTYFESSQSASFAQEFEVDLNLLRKNIEVGIHPKDVVQLNNTIKKYQERVLCVDSIFVGYFNAHQRMICYHFNFYQIDINSIDYKKNLDNSIEALQNFIHSYYLQRMQHDFQIAFNLESENEVLMQEVKRCKFKCNDQEDIIIWDAFEEKLRFLMSEIANLELYKVDKESINISKKLHAKMLELSNQIQNFKNFK